MNERLNTTEDTLSHLHGDANQTAASLDALRQGAEDLERSVREIRQEVDNVKNSNIQGERGGERERESPIGAE